MGGGELGGLFEREGFELAELSHVLVAGKSQHLFTCSSQCCSSTQYPLVFRLDTRILLTEVAIVERGEIDDLLQRCELCLKIFGELRNSFTARLCFYEMGGEKGCGGDMVLSTELVKRIHCFRSLEPMSEFVALACDGIAEIGESLALRLNRIEHEDTKHVQRINLGKVLVGRGSCRGSAVDPSSRSGSYVP